MNKFRKIEQQFFLLHTPNPQPIAACGFGTFYVFDKKPFVHLQLFSY